MLTLDFVKSKAFVKEQKPCLPRKHPCLPLLTPCLPRVYTMLTPAFSRYFLHVPILLSPHFPLYTHKLTPCLPHASHYCFQAYATDERNSLNSCFCLRGEKRLGGTCKLKETTCTRLSQTGASASLCLIFCSYLDFINIFT